MRLQEKYTVSEASELLGFKSRSTINARTNDSGINAISYETDSEGNKVISHIELERVYPDKMKAALKRINNTANAQHEDTGIAHKNTGDNTENTPDMKVLNSKVQFLEEQLSYERSEREREREEAKLREERAEAREKDLSAKLDKAQSTIDKQTYLITDMTEKPSQTPVEPRKKFLGIF